MPTSLARTPRSVLLTAVLAAVVAFGAFGAVYVLRPKPDIVGGSAAEPAAGPAIAPVSCGRGPCRKLAAMTVGGQPVELLADAAGDNGRVRIGPEPGTVLDLTIGQLGLRLDANSLRCVDGTNPACLVRGAGDRGAYGELLIASAGGWVSAGKPYFSDAATLALDDVNADGKPDLVVVRHVCPGSESGTPQCQAAPVLAEVYDQTSRLLGCTKKVTSPSQLRGWPEIKLIRSDLRACP